MFVSLTRAGSASDLSEFLHTVFKDQAGRSPSGSEINYYSGVVRNQGSLEGYIQLLGSEDYFVTQAQWNWETYVTRLYQTFLGRSPSSSELRFWVTQFQNQNTCARGIGEAILPRQSSQSVAE